MSKSSNGLDAQAKELLCPEEVAAMLSIGTRTLWRWVSEGLFPAADVRVGTRVVRWTRSSVSLWIEEQQAANRH